VSGGVERVGESERDVAGAAATRAEASLPAGPAAIAAARCLICAHLEAAQWRGDNQAEVLLAAMEAVENAVEHGSRPGGVIDLEFRAEPSCVDLAVQDAGGPGAGVPEGPPEAPPLDSVRGRGLVIMNRLAERMEAVAAGAGTRVELRFRREEAQPA
jgi:serine/threonine-protein kinase RsbW